MLRCLLIEDYQLVAWALRLLVQDNGHHVVGIAPCPDRAVEIAIREQPDIALVDIRLEGGTSGLDAARRLWAMRIPTLFVTAYRNDAEAMPGVIGVLLKPYSRRDICYALEACEKVMKGQAPGNVPSALVLFRKPFEGELPAVIPSSTSEAGGREGPDDP